jgi:hypothetical protein
VSYRYDKLQRWYDDFITNTQEDWLDRQYNMIDLESWATACTRPGSVEGYQGLLWFQGIIIHMNQALQAEFELGAIQMVALDKYQTQLCSSAAVIQTFSLDDYFRDHSLNLRIPYEEYSSMGITEVTNKFAFFKHISFYPNRNDSWPCSTADVGDFKWRMFDTEPSYPEADWNYSLSVSGSSFGTGTMAWIRQVSIATNSRDAPKIQRNVGFEGVQLTENKTLPSLPDYLSKTRNYGTHGVRKPRGK